MPPPSEGLRKAASRYLMRDCDPDLVMIAFRIRWICIALGAPIFMAVYLVLGSPRTLFVWMGCLMLPYLLLNVWAYLAARQRFPRLMGWFLMVVDLASMSVPFMLFHQLRLPLLGVCAVMVLGGATMWSSRPAAIATAIGFGWCALALAFGTGSASLGGSELGLFPQPKHAHDIAALVLALLIVMLAGAMTLHNLGLMRRRAKAAEGRYRAVFEAVNSPIFIIDRETGGYLDANEAALREVRLSRDEVLRSQLGDLMMPESKARLREWLLENPQSLGHPVVHHLVKREGRELFVEMSVGTAEFHGHEVVVAAVRDRTSEMQLQKAGREYAERLEVAVAQRTEELERANRELRKVQSRLVQAERLGVAGEMVGGIAHAIYNPMTALIGTLQMRLEGRRRPYPGDESILRLAQRIKSIVEKMLALARRGEMHLEPTDLGELMSGLCEELAERCTSHAVEIETRFEPDLPLVTLDRTLLTTALAGIAENAVDAMTDGGKLRLDVERVSGAEAVRVRIRDTGPGIPEDIQSQIFQPFFSTKPSGVGLGLAIARGVILGHEGSLQVHSKLGVGTEVSVEIPVRGVRASLGVSKEEPAAVRAQARA